MHLTETQQFVLELLRMFGCLREDQIISFIKLKFGQLDKEPLRWLNRMVASLSSRLYRPLEGYVGIKHTLPKLDRITACDLVLDYRRYGLLTYSAGTDPFEANFAKETGNGVIRTYDVAVVHKGQESLISQLVMVKSSGRPVIFILDDAAQSELFCYPAEHYFAVRESNKFRYFKGVVVRS